MHRLLVLIALCLLLPDLARADYDALIVPGPSQGAGEAGGSEEASEQFGEGCVGRIARNPDHLLIVEEDGPVLLEALGDPRLSLVLAGESGHWCAAPGPDGAPPRLTEELPAGTYGVFIGAVERAAMGQRYTVRAHRDTAAAFPGPSDQDDAVALLTGDTTLRLLLHQEAPRYQTFVLDIPKGSSSFLVRALGGQRDLDLFLRRGQPIGNYETDPDVSATSTRSEEQLWIGPPKYGSPAGRWFLDVVRASEDSIGPVSLELTLDAPAPDPLPAASGPIVELVPGARHEVDLSESGHRSGRFRVEVPEGHDALHVVVLGATRDIDLYARHGAEITDYHEESGYDVRAFSMRLSESLLIDGASDPPLQAGTWYIDAASLISSDLDIRFAIVATLDAPPVLTDQDLPLPPFSTRGWNRLERTLSATVEIASELGSGSGTVLTPSGLVLTNHHVLYDSGVLQREDIYISFLREVDQPPVQVFRAEVVDADADLDLALLRIVDDILGRPLEEPLRLPFARLGDPTALRLGDPLLVAGYPGVGGPESRASISLTRGVVSGFITDPSGARLEGDAWIKTDARINAGNSGGSAFDQRLRLVGVPSLEIIEADDELGFCRPITVLPAAWRELIDSEL